MGKTWKRMWVGAAPLLACGALATASEADWRARVKTGATMRAGAASFFGGAGAERFEGVVRETDGSVLAYGNSWGSPFPAVPVTVTVLGPDTPRDVPLFSGGTPGDDYPYSVPPEAHHAGRTGFFVRYAADLSRVEAVTRFGWGVATADAALRLADGGLVVSGMARAGFPGDMAQAASVRRFPAGKGPYYGSVTHGGVSMPGDVYVARWRPTMDGFDWVWILERHVDPPSRLFEAPDGVVVFDCRGVKRIGADGQSLEAVLEPDEPSQTQNRFLAGVSPRGGGLLFAGWQLSRSGSKEWLGPVLEERKTGNREGVRYYDWRAPLVCQPTLALTAAAGITHAGYLADGSILVGAPTRFGRSVLERSPVDLTVQAAGRGVLADELVAFGNPSPWRSAPRCALARFDPGSPSNAVFACWTGVSREGRDSDAEALVMEGLAAPDPDHVALWGGSGGALLTTVDPVPVGTNAQAIARWKVKPATPFLTVFSRDFGAVRWSGLTPRFTIGDVARTARGIVAAGAFRQPWKYELFEPVAAPGAQETFGGGYCDGYILLLEETR